MFLLADGHGIGEAEIAALGSKQVGVPGFFVGHDYIDILVHGDGEIPFSEILRKSFIIFFISFSLK